MHSLTVLCNINSVLKCFLIVPQNYKLVLHYTDILYWDLY